MTTRDPNATTAAAEVTITPPASSWGSLLHRPPPALPAGAPSRPDVRAELGLPTSGPIILTGHQAEFWHPGIFAKYIAADAAARALGAATGWVVVDQDSNRPAEIHYPAKGPDGRLVRRTWNALPGTDPLVAANVPLGAIAATPPAPIVLDENDRVSDGVKSGLEHIRDALSVHRGAPSVAHQAAAALRECLGNLVTPAPMVFASGLGRTGLFTWLLERIKADPAACARTYNEAVAAHPAARMAPLAIGDETELPLWHIATGAAPRRTRARRSHLNQPGLLVPRALLMTGALRLAACDLFIHGLGGGVYDTITEAWMRRWLGVELAPTCVVTATLRLPLGSDDVTPQEIDRAAWKAHHARHDPRLLGDAAAAERKAALVQRIGELKRSGVDPSPVFRELQSLLDDVRRSASERLEQLAHAAADARSRRAESAVAHDRTWPAPLYDHAALEGLKREIEARFA